MALRTIVQDGDPILKKVCRPVTKFDDRLGTLLDDMKETLLAANGLGLAGPQVGMMRRLFICLDDRDLPEEVPANYEYKFIEFINPEILELSDEQVELYEGCLSFPGHNGAIKRSKHVKVKAQDRHGEWFELEADDMLARCIQHENNHLDGITIMDLAEHFYEDDYPEENEDQNLCASCLWELLTSPPKAWPPCWTPGMRSAVSLPAATSPWAASRS